MSEDVLAHFVKGMIGEPRRVHT